MIFSRLFNTKNKWQAKDINVRIAAINEDLSVSNAEEKTVLLSLLNTDSNELVRRAALLKLNDFDTYVLTSTNNDNSAVKKFSYAQVELIVSNQHDIKLSDSVKHNFIQECSSKELLEHWLGQEQDPELVVKLYKQVSLNKNVAHLFTQVFGQKQTTAIQLQLLNVDVPELTEVAFLNKLIKKSASDEVKSLLEKTLSELVDAQEKPKKLQKGLQLTLSKLLALKDVTDYEQYLEKRHALVEQWQNDIGEISCLDAEQQVLLTQKYDKICEQLTQLFVSKAELFQQDKIAKQLVKAKQASLADFTASIENMNRVLTTAVFEDETLDEQEFTQQLTTIENNIRASVLNEQEQAKFLALLRDLAKRLTQLPEIARSVTDATHLISKISQLSLPQALCDLNDRQTTYNQWLSQWNIVQKKALGVLPQSIVDAHSEITTSWQQGLKPLQIEQKQLFSQTKKKLIDVKRLLNNGKYKVCFGLFKGIKQSVPMLSTNQQQQLQRDFEQVSEKIADISDWEHYIATPRKQELLEKVTQLVQTPLDNPNEQAVQVKSYRKTWNSLGHADEEVDKELNEKFNQACEQAFAPCRLFYAEQDKLRGQHLVERKKLIEQAKTIANQFEENSQKELSADDKGASYKELDGQLNKLQQSWNQAGEVDRKDYQPLQQTFKQTLQPLKSAIHNFHDANSSLKQTLIKQAEQELVTEDIFQAIENVKKLQQQWRSVGFAGSRQENKLWQEFRKVNDEIFAKREQVKSAQQQAQIEINDQFSQSLESIVTQLGATTDKALLNQAKDEAEQLRSNVIAQKPVNKAIVQKVESFINSINKQLETITQQEGKKSWRSLFVLLKLIANSESNELLNSINDMAEFNQLTSFWQKRIQEQLNLATQTTTDERLSKTLAIEILAKAESPIEFAQQRMVVQVQLMQEQMQSGNDIDLNKELVSWLKLGKLSSDDVSLLGRLETIFVD